jgi:hypothetical protein
MLQPSEAIALRQAEGLYSPTAQDSIKLAGSVSVHALTMTHIITQQVVDVQVTITRRIFRISHAPTQTGKIRRNKCWDSLLPNPAPFMGPFERGAH